MSYKKKDTIKINGEWEDSLMWCPTQCYLNLEYQGEHYTLYLRWRWDDPFTADLIENFDKENEKWHELDINYWTDEQLEECKINALEKAKELILRINNEKRI